MDNKKLSMENGQIPPHADYCILLFLLLLLTLTLLPKNPKEALGQPWLWISLSSFVVICTVIELVALNSGWWVFNEDRIIGTRLLGIPIEEYLIFVLIHFLITFFWIGASNDLE